MNKAVFLDRDGTINVDYGYVYKIEDLKFIDGVFKALQILSNLGYKLIIVTNQSGIGRGFYSDEEYLKFNNHMLKLLKDKNVIIDGVYYCPHISSDNCDCRKPKIGMAKQAAKELKIDLKKSYMIGDSVRDYIFGYNFGGKGILVLTGHGKKQFAKVKDEKQKPLAVVRSLSQTVEVIKNDYEKN